MPLETFRRTLSSGDTRSPDPGFWAMTVPSGSSEKTSNTRTSRPALASRSRACCSGSPTAFGTTTVAGPVEVRIVTVLPSSSSVPAEGRCSNTVPRGAALARLTMSVSKPSSWSRETATSRGCEVTAGTALSSLRVKYQSAPSPMSAASRRIASAGQKSSNGPRIGRRTMRSRSCSTCPSGPTVSRSCSVATGSPGARTRARIDERLG